MVVVVGQEDKGWLSRLKRAKRDPTRDSLSFFCRTKKAPHPRHTSLSRPQIVLQPDFFGRFFIFVPARAHFSRDANAHRSSTSAEVLTGGSYRGVATGLVGRVIDTWQITYEMRLEYNDATRGRDA